MDKWLKDIQKGIGKIISDQTKEGGILEFLQEFGLDKDKLLTYICQGTSASGKAFERMVEHYFKAKKYKTKRNEILEVKDDFGIGKRLEVDLMAIKGKETIRVECKHKKSAMPPQTLLDYANTTLRIQKDKKIEYNPNKLLLISIGGFSNKAIEKAEEINEKRKDLKIELWDEKDFLDRYYPIASDLEKMGWDLKESLESEEEEEDEEEW